MDMMEIINALGAIATNDECLNLADIVPGRASYFTGPVLMQDGREVNSISVVRSVKGVVAIRLSNGESE